MPSQIDRCWRVAASSRALLASFLLIVFMAFLIGALATGVTRDAVIALVGLAALFAVGWWACAGRPRVILTDSCVVVVNPLWTHRRELTEVVDVRAGWSGVWINSRSRRPVAAWAVQKANISTWTRRPTRADAVVAAILAARPEG